MGTLRINDYMRGSGAEGKVRKVEKERKGVEEIDREK